MITIFTYLGAILPLITFGVLVVFWLGTRSRYPVGALPWIIAYFIGIAVLAFLGREHGELLPRAFRHLADDNTYAAYFSTWLFLAPAMPGVLIALLALSNGAYLLPDERQESRILNFFKGIYHHRTWFGVLLLLIPILKFLSVWWVVLRYHSP